MIGSHSKGEIRSRITSWWQLKIKLLNKEIRLEFHHHDIYLTSIIFMLRKKSHGSLLKRIIFVGKREY